MKTVMWWLASLLLLAAAGCVQEKPQPSLTDATSQVASGDGGTRTYPLFIIERSKNANTVHYDAQLTADGRLDPEEPVIAYYIMLAEDGRRKELNWVEKKLAYGFDIKPTPSQGEYKMTMVAARERSITVRRVGSVVRAEMVIDGRTAILDKIYINASDGLPWPKVHHIDLYGRDEQTGEERFERVVPK